jgi:hypothetical protein
MRNGIEEIYTPKHVKIVEIDTHLSSLKEEIRFFLCDVIRPTFLFAQLCGYLIDLAKYVGKT